VLGRAVTSALRSAAAALVATTWAAAAAAQSPEPGVARAPAPLELVWQGPADCERGGAVRAKVLRLLGSRQAALPSVKVTVTVAREAPSRYVAHLETVTAQGGGSKRLEGESCDAIALASSVVIALSIDPNASLDAEEPAQPEPEPKPKLRPLPSPRRSRPAPKPQEARETKPYLHGSIGVLFGLVGDPSAFTTAGIGARYRRLSLELGGAVYQPRDVTRPDRPKVGAELRLFSGELLGCYAVVPFGLGALEVCPGLRLESLSARSFGVSNPDTGQVLLMSGLAVLRGRLHPTSWLSATLDAGLAARPFHPTFVLLGVGDVYEIPVLSPFARTGLAVEF
jgi:hypothetical protein